MATENHCPFWNSSVPKLLYELLYRFWLAMCGVTAKRACGAMQDNALKIRGTRSEKN